MVTQSNKIIYTQYYVAFLDVLGFKKLVLSQRKDDSRKIEKYFELIEDATLYLKEIKAEMSLGSIVISDAVILSVPVGETITEKIENLRHLCVAVGKIQFQLALNNIWVRGAISSGDAYFNPTENQVVGPAYIWAYLLEGSQAKYPRVILDNKIINELRANSAQDLIEIINNKKEGGLKFRQWSKYILYEWQHNDFIKKKLNRDVPLFIDYLHPVFDNQTNFTKIISSINKSIYSGNDVYGKFRWVVDYLISNSEFYLKHNLCNIENSTLRMNYNKLQKY